MLINVYNVYSNKVVYVAVPAFYLGQRACIFSQKKTTLS